jgi:hypothetical protein
MTELKLNEVEKESLLLLLAFAKIAFENSKYNEKISGYSANFSGFLPTQWHIKALKTIENKIEKN